jgi:hypothetical protein
MPIVFTSTYAGQTFTVTNEAIAAAITAQIANDTLWYKQNFAALSQINNSVQAMKDNAKLTAKAVSDMQIALASVATATSSQTVITAAMASNQIKTNNFQMQATKDALIRTGQPVPVIPPIVDQLTEVVKDSVTMNGVAVAEGAVVSYIVSQTGAIAVWITETDIYRDLTAWLKQAKDTIIGVVLPPSAAATTSNANVLAGNPVIGPVG